MAFGYAKSTGRVGAFTVVPGPGVLNSAAALCTAYGAIAPVLCITGNIMSHFIGSGRGQLHELPDQLATLRGHHQMVRAHRPPVRGAGDHGRGVSPDDHRSAPAGRRRAAVERVQQRAPVDLSVAPASTPRRSRIPT